LKKTVRKKGTKAVTGAVPFQKGTLLYQKGAYAPFRYKSVPWGYSDSFRTFFFWQWSTLWI